jgi:hypothetical protein
MAVTINVNGLTLCHKGSNGISTATVPDVCKTPSPGGPVPIPYPNVAMSSDLAKGTTTITADGGNMCANYGSEFSVSTGDEPGTVGGVKSSVFKKEATWILYSVDVKLEGKGACRLTDKMFHNHQNTVNAAGLVQIVVDDDLLNLLCNVFCETLEAGEKFKADPKNAGKKFNYSKHAKDLADNPKYAKHFAKHGIKAEVRLLARLSQATRAGLKQVDGVTKRALYTAEEVVKRLRSRAQRQVAEMVGKKVAGKAVKSLVAKFIPVVNVISVAMDIYDAYELYKVASEILEAGVESALKEFAEVVPDVAKVGADGAVTDIYDYKFPGDRFRDSQDDIFTDATGKRPQTVDLKSCNNCGKPKAAK